MLCYIYMWQEPFSHIWSRFDSRIFCVCASTKPGTQHLDFENTPTKKALTIACRPASVEAARRWPPTSLPTRMQATPLASIEGWKAPL